MRLKGAPQKLNLVMTNLYQKGMYQIVAANALARSRMVTCSNTASFLIASTLCETENILFRKSY